MEIVRQPNGVTNAFRLMNQTSVLGRYVLAVLRLGDAVHRGRIAQG
jgi:UTP:GlnB (protein PII) uridylyltransferase